MYSAENCTESFEINEKMEKAEKVTFIDPVEKPTSNLNKGGIRRVKSTPNHFSKSKDEEVSELW